MILSDPPNHIDWGQSASRPFASRSTLNVGCQDPIKNPFS